MARRFLSTLSSLTTLLLLLCVQPLSASPPQNVAFYYGNEAPLGALMAYDWMVLQQDQASDARIELLQEAGTLPLSYISMGEMARSHRYV